MNLDLLKIFGEFYRADEPLYEYQVGAMKNKTHQSVKAYLLSLKRRGYIERVHDTPPTWKISRTGLEWWAEARSIIKLVETKEKLNGA